MREEGGQREEGRKEGKEERRQEGRIPGHMASHPKIKAAAIDALQTGLQIKGAVSALRFENIC